MGFFGAPNIEKLKAKGNVKGLIKALDYKKDANVRKAAAGALGQIGNEQAVEPLIGTLKDENRQVQEAAVKSLGRINNERVITPLLEAYKNEYLRKFAIKGLITSLEHGKTSVRRAVTMALGRIKEVWAMQLLINALKDSSNEMRYTAAEALGKNGYNQAVRPLITAIKSEDEKMNEIAIKALKDIGLSGIEAFITAPEKGDWGKRLAVAEALEYLEWQPDKSELAAIYWIMKQQWEKCVEVGVPAVESLILTLTGKDENMRGKAAWALAQIGDSRAIIPLINSLKDEDSGVHEATIKALKEIGQPAIGKLLTTLKKGDWETRLTVAKALKCLEWQPDKSEAGAIYWIMQQQWDKCVEIGVPAVEPLILILNGRRDGDMRGMAAWALGQIADPRAVEPLIGILNVKERSVRKASALALVNMYKAGKLDNICKNLILNQRQIITSHTDSSEHTDATTGHTDRTESTLKNVYGSNGQVFSGDCHSEHADYGKKNHTDYSHTDEGIGDVDFPI